jgi:ADP-dependent NAD(P)H-hydrate dehydratase
MERTVAEFVVPQDLPRLSRRELASHKGSFGTALLVGGSRGMAGAIALAGMGALRSGAGKVRCAVPDVCLETVAQFEPSYMTVGLDCDEHGCLESSALEKIQSLAENATCVAVGPGLTCSPAIGNLVGWLYRTLPQPLLVDADGLNALASADGALVHSGGARILTPHPGEFARLCKSQRMNVDAARSAQSDAAVELAAKFQLVIVLKGHQTLITDGHARNLNSTGNPGMATGGTGDVLAGVITALVCQGMSPFDAARLGVFAHGLAGDLAAASIGQVGLTARDLLQHLPQAWLKLA